MKTRHDATTPMNVHVLQHVPFEGLGSIGPWLAARQARVGWTRLFAGDALPAPERFDMLVALGGPMSVNDGAAFPWLVAEKRLIRDVIARDVPVLGVCLGAQLIASALGAEVYPNRVKEIGWFPVRAVSAPDSAFRFPRECPAFHWHGETFDLPQGAVHLARSDNCAHQAFQLKRNVVGLQFHLETTIESAQALVEHCKDELVDGPCIQTRDELLSAPAGRYAAANALMNDVLNHLIEGLSSRRLPRGGRSVHRDATDPRSV